MLGINYHYTKYTFRKSLQSAVFLRNYISLLVIKIKKKVAESLKKDMGLLREHLLSLSS